MRDSASIANQHRESASHRSIATSQHRNIAASQRRSITASARDIIASQLSGAMNADLKTEIDDVRETVDEAKAEIARQKFLVWEKLIEMNQTLRAQDAKIKNLNLKVKALRGRVLRLRRTLAQAASS